MTLPFPTVRRLARPLVALAILAGCSDSTAPRVPTSLALSQTSVTMDALGASEAVTASVLDQNGAVMEGIPVTWTSNSPAVTVVGSPASSASRAAARAVALGGGALAMEASAIGVHPAVITAAADGAASIVATAGSLTNTITVDVTQLPVAPEKLEGDLQSATVGSELPLPLRVRIHDRLGNAMPGRIVTFAVSSGAGSVSSSLEMSDISGMVSTSWTLGTATVPQQLAVSVNGTTATSSYSATARAGAPVQLSVAAGDAQSAPVGTRVAAAPVARVTDSFGNGVPGMTITFTPAEGSGSVAVTTATTLAAGSGAPGSWTLGTTPGPQSLTASVANLPPVTFAATALVGPPAALSIASANNQSTPTSSAVTVSPAVRVADAFGNPIAGVTVTYSVVSGGGSVTGGSAVSDATGVATVGAWILGTTPGTNTAVASTPGTSAVTFTATAFAPPAAIEVIAGQSQTAFAGTVVSIPPSIRVLDILGNPAVAVPVTFTVDAGGGTITGASTTTNGSGIATIGSWTLGPVTGTNALSATVPGFATQFIASGIVGPAANVGVSAGNNQSAIAGNAVSTPPAVFVSDAFGNAIAGASVTFAIANGDGSITDATTTTNANGVATVGSWTLGLGTNVLVATVSGAAIAGNPVLFTATGFGSGGGGGAGPFNIDVRYLTSVTPAQRDAFDAAASRWSTVIAGDISNIDMTNTAAVFCAPAMNEIVDDVVIFITVTAIDGVGGILGSAGPCWTRLSNGLPITGRMTLDIADMANLEANGLLTGVILHEMGHVLGIGTLWGSFVNSRSTVGGPSLDTFFSGANAIAGFNEIGGLTYSGGQKVPVENIGGSGTINAHWRESVLANELMTGFIAPGLNPLSMLTVRSLEDIGYSVNSAAADPFFLSLALRAAGSPPLGRVELLNDIMSGPIFRR